MMATEGIAALPPEIQLLIWNRVRNFTDFEEGNDRMENMISAPLVLPL
jgi:hypothetical protein